MDRVNIFNLDAIRKVAEGKMMMLRLWAYLSDCLQILHTAPLGGLVVPFGVYEL